MSQFMLEAELSDVLKMDGPIQRGPAMRWQRKQCDADSNIKVNPSLNASAVPLKSPLKGLSSNKPLTKSPSPGRTSGPRTVLKSAVKMTPGKVAKTPADADKFIPNHTTTQFDLGHLRIMQENQPQLEDGEIVSPSKLEYHKVTKMTSENLDSDLKSKKIISYKTKAPMAPEGHSNSLQVLYSSCKTPASTAKKTRNIPQVPVKILDAPEILDDYYLNLLDWSVNNHVAVALGSNVYVWNASTGDITQLLQLESAEQYVGAVSWVTEGNILAVGTSSGDVQLWDVAQQKRLRNMTGHSARVGSLSWNSYILSSGSRSGNIHNHDVRLPQHHIGMFAGHSQDVCGLKWSPDGRYLASGGNDNLLNIWSAQMVQSSQTPAHPVYSFSQHLAAVKAVAWCPWQHNILASGGGTADRNIRFWNVSNGTCLNAIDTKSQVCALLWSHEYKELISSHGFALNQLIIWKYPAMTKVVELIGHTARVLHLAMSPDGTTVASAGADETLRIWKCFAVDNQTKTSQKAIPLEKDSSLAKLHKIR